MKRKEFIRSGGRMVVAMMIPAWVLKSCGTIHYASATEEKGRLIIPKKEFQNIRKNKISEREFILVQTNHTPAPIGIYKSGKDRYTAALLLCTHRGCELTPGGAIYSCPCHGSEFSMEGEVLEGPAEEHLQTYNITTDHENIYIHLQ